MSVVNVSVKFIRPKYSNIHEWMKDANNIYIGRSCHYVGVNASIWANPYSVKKYGRDEALRLYRIHVEGKLKDRLPELKGKTLGCWCHGDVLLEMLDELEE